ncbi:GbsR/MarR family transcriptional regulator [Virgibacillus sp. SK37]|uniref:choline uptake/conversion transcriptional regulator CudC n=1 Tax=Virgibacillus sp. SK37 TaxID=403957 RepID=UPI0005957254|nr:GbsR/MarR family transcriptional regulator [Virgibacillus sp. SK37]
MEGKQNNSLNGNAEEKIDQVERMMINTISETMDLYGVTPSVGRLYATMYFKHEPITLDEMKDALGMSKPSMSTSVRKLQEINIVQKVWQKGSRKDSFIAEKNFFNYFTQFYGMKWEREVSMYLASLKKAQALLKEVIEDSETDEASREKAELDYQQLADAMVYYRWLEKLTKLTKSGEIFDYIPVDDVDEV